MLALHVNETVSADRLSEGLWGERAPPTAPKMVQLYVSQLRKLLRGSAGEIVTRGRGYELRLAVECVDAARFERLVAEAARDDGTPNGEARAALELWRGSPIADVAYEPFASAEIRRLEELRLQAAELAIDADLAARRHQEVLGELRSMIAEDPLRERLRAQHMLALYRSGRQGDALVAYRDARTALVEAIGVEPGPELRSLHEAILRQDPRLDLPEAGEGSRLPPELDASTPLVGRADELEWLRAHWRDARAGAGRLVLVAGERGIGKTRLVAELAGEVLREGGDVLHGSMQAPEEALAAAGTGPGPTLLVLDDIGHGPSLDVTDERLAGREESAVLVVATAERFTRDAMLRAAGTLTLAPLDAGGVRDLARPYAGGGGDVDVPVERLLAASGGVPERLHRAASEWARTLEMRRLVESVGRITADRSGLRAAEDDLVASIVALQAAGERSDREAVGAGAVCPFMGLAPFRAADAGFFFGRERFVAEMLARLTGTPFLGIVGPSGSGKSSALHAGLLAALAAGVLPGSERWALAALRPGEHPSRALESAVAAAPAEGRLVVAVDQFEETFTACGVETERVAFVDALVASARDARRPTLVILAVRADYYGRCAAYAELSRLLGAGQVLVGPLSRDELRRAIELPARQAGLLVERDLVDALVADAEGQAGALPLVSSALLELWQRRDGASLRLADYERSGGMHGAVARLAEQAYERLDPDGRVIARRVLLRLAGEGEGDAVVRRRVPLAELEGDGVAEVLGVLAGDRLVTIGEDEVEVAHEALLREWPRLRAWLEEDAEGRRLHQHLIHAAREWVAGGREPGELYRGSRLAAALEWRAGHAEALNRTEREFLATSESAAEVEGQRQRRVNRRLRGLLAGVGVLLALAVVAGAVAVRQRGEAREAAVIADAQRVGAEAVTRERIDQSVLLARAGVALDDSAGTRGSLLSALMRDPLALGVLPGDVQGLFVAAASPDGRLLALGSVDGDVVFVDAASRRPVGSRTGCRMATFDDLEFSPDGRTLAVAGQEPPVPGSGGLVDLVETRTHERRLRIVPPQFPEFASWVGLSVLFAPDGRDVIVEQVHQSRNIDGPPSLLRRFDGKTGAAVGRPLRVGRHASIGMSATGDGRRLFLTSPVDGETAMVDAERLRLLRRWPVGALTGTVSADGRSFALGSQDGGVRLLDLRSGRVRSFHGRHGGFVDAMRFTPDGRTLVTTGVEGKLLVWDVAGGRYPRSADRSRQEPVAAPRRLAGRAHRLQRRRGRARLRVGPHRRPEPHAPVRRPAVRPRRRRPAAARPVPQPGRPHPRPRAQRRDGRLPRRPDVAPATEREGTARLGRCDRLQRRRPHARRRGPARAGDALGRAHAATGRRAEATGRRVEGAPGIHPDDRLLARRRAARRRGDGVPVARRGCVGHRRRKCSGLGRAAARAHGRALRGVVALDRLQSRRPPHRGRRHRAAHRGARRPQRPSRREPQRPGLGPLGGVLS